MPGLFNPNKKEEPSDKKKSGGLFSPKTNEAKEKKSNGGLFKAPDVSSKSIPLITDTKWDTTKLDKSIENAKIRIKDAGGEVDKDDRNWVEKKLNLPEGQNWFFDALEVIGRPQQALYGGVEAFFDGENGKILGNALEGFKGNEKRSFTNVIDSYGRYTEDKLGENKAEKIGLTEPGWRRSAANFIGNVVADPINLVPGGVVTKAVKPVGQIGGKVIKSIPGLTDKVIEPTKDALGSIFKYQHGWDETLTGDKDGTIKELFNDTQNIVRNKTDDALKNVTEQARLAGGYKAGDDVGRIMESNLESSFVGPKLPSSSDPNIIQAADNLVKSNNEIRQWANDMGVSIDELQGYMTHLLSSEERAFRKTSKGKRASLSGTIGITKPNDKILNKRKYAMTAEEANELVGRKMFEPNAFFSTALGQKRLIEYVGAKKFMDNVLSNPSFAMKKDDFLVQYGSIPDDLVTISPDQFKFFKVDIDDGKSIMGVAKGQEYVVTKGVRDALQRFNNVTTDQGIRNFLRGYDKVQGWWKRLALLSVPYHVRNLIGGMFNNYVGGMNSVDMARYTTEAGNTIQKALRGKETPLYKEFREQGLSSSSQMAVDLARAGDTPEKAIEKAVKDRSKSKLRRGADKLNPLRAFQTSQELGTVIDQTNRFALYKWARDKGMSPKDAARKVREVQFDYTRTTNAEREVFTRFVPFYRWSRNNIPFQLRQFINNPAKYARVGNAIEAQQENVGIDDTNMPGYMKEGMYIPWSGDGQGSGKLLAMNLPAADLTKLTNPGKLFVDSLTPLAKLPIELSSNTNFFFGNEIQKFRDEEKKYQIPENIWGMDIPGGGTQIGGLPVKTAYAVESLGGQPARGLSGLISKPTVAEQENQSLKPSLGIRSLLKNYDINESNYRAKQRELEQLLDYLKYLEQETGERPRTISDIKRGIR